MSMHNYRGVSAEATEWEDVSADDYEGSVSHCELQVDILANDHHDILAALEYDKRKGGALGRALRWDVPSCGLKKTRQAGTKCVVV